MKDSAHLATLDGVAQAELVAKGELRPRDLLDAFVERLNAVDPVVRSVVTVDVERSQGARGSFSGVPFLVKDITPVRGMRWSMGSRAFAENVAPVSPPYVEKIEEAGLVIVGKSATSEFGLVGSTETLLEGVTHNPWDLSRSAAGSSGGAAAAVAAGIVPLAHANDGGGSTRIPASVCGLFGFKPSRGRTHTSMLARSDFGDITSDHCISRTVRDSALFLSVTEKKDESPVGYVQTASTRRLRVASWSRTLVGGEPTPAVQRAHEDVVELLRSLGHEVTPIEAVTISPAEDGAELRDAFFIIAGAAVSGIADMLAHMHGRPPGGDAFEPFTWALVDEYRRQGPKSLERARSDVARITKRYLAATADFDVVVTPTLAAEPWPIGHLSPLLSRPELIERTAAIVGYTPIQNVAGCPAMSVPLSWSESGLPIGAHFAAAPGDERTLLELAYELEAARPWRDRWAPFSYPKLHALRCRKS